MAGEPPKLMTRLVLVGSARRPGVPDSRWAMRRDKSDTPETRGEHVWAKGSAGETSQWGRLARGTSDSSGSLHRESE